MQAKEIELEHLQHKLAKKDSVIEEARSSEAEAKVSEAQSTST